MSRIKKWISHNQGVALALVISAVMTIWMLGCESKVTSLVDDKKMVTAAELDDELSGLAARMEMELEQLVKRAHTKNEQLEKQTAIKQKIMDFALLSSEAGKLNPTGILGLVFSVFGIGAMADNRIKDKVIKNRPLSVEKGRGEK